MRHPHLTLLSLLAVGCSDARDVAVPGASPAAVHIEFVATVHDEYLEEVHVRVADGAPEGFAILGYKLYVFDDENGTGVEDPGERRVDQTATWTEPTTHFMIKPFRRDCERPFLYGTVDTSAGAAVYAPTALADLKP